MDSLRQHCSGAIIWRLENIPQVLLLQRKVDGVTWWGFPGGKQEPGESREECVCRELREELGRETKVEEYIGAYSGAGPSGKPLESHLFLMEFEEDYYGVNLNEESCGFAWIRQTEIKTREGLMEPTKAGLAELVARGLL